MSDDAVRLQGRQTKWSYIMALLLAALASLLGALIASGEIPSDIGLSGLWSRAETDVWMTIPEEGRCAALGEKVLLAGNGYLATLDLTDGSLQQEPLDMQDPVVQANGGYAAVYEPCGDTLLLLGENESWTAEVPAGIDLAVAGPWGQAAVVTAGSGYLTETILYDADGQRLDAIGLTDQAMVQMVYLDDGTLASCCVSREGQWFLRLYGAETGVIALTAMVYDMRSWGRGVALWTSEGLTFYDGSGTETFSLALPPDRVLDWDCGDVAAVLVRRMGRYQVLTVSPEGQLWESELLSVRPRQLLAVGNRVCTLDSEALLVYDNSSGFRRDLRGGQTVELVKAEDAVLLVGDGELLYTRLS